MYIQVMSSEQLQQHQLSMHSLFWHCYFQSHPIYDPDLMIEALIQMLPHASNFPDSATSFLSQLYLGMTICCLAFVTRCPEHSSDQALVRKSLSLLATSFDCSIFSFEQKVVSLYPFAARLVISPDGLSFLLNTNTHPIAFVWLRHIPATHRPSGPSSRRALHPPPHQLHIAIILLNTMISWMMSWRTSALLWQTLF